MNLAIYSPPLLGELHLRVDVFNRNGEVDEVQVEVFQAPEVKRVFAALFNLSPVSVKLEDRWE